MLSLDAKTQVLIDNDVCTSGEIGLVADINGYNEQMIEYILYAREGYSDIYDWCADNNINIMDYEEYN